MEILNIRIISVNVCRRLSLNAVVHRADGRGVTQLSTATDRRFRRTQAAGPTVLPCRVCFEAVEIQPDRVELTELYAFYCCQFCGGSFPIRREDVPSAAAAD